MHERKSHSLGQIPIFKALSLVACITTLFACRPSLPQSFLDAPSHVSKMLYISLDGFGMPTPGKSDDAIAAHLATAEPKSFLRRALMERRYPMTQLEASGPCVGLPTGVIGNSEAGHNALCSGRSVTQRRTYIDTILNAEPSVQLSTPLGQTVQQTVTNGGAVHLIFYLSESSSVGYYGHLAPLIRLARHASPSQNQPLKIYGHVICDDYAKTDCRTLFKRVSQEIPDFEEIEFLSLAGSKQCMGRITEKEAWPCAQNILGNTTPSPTSNPIQTLLPTEMTTSLEPRALKNYRLSDADLIVFNAYRRDIAYGLAYALREFRSEDKRINKHGPTVLTFGYLGDTAIYQQDSKLQEAFGLKQHHGVFSDLTELHLKQARMSESKKRAHTTYFCDGRAATDPTTRYIHPTSKSIVRQPCGRTADVVQAFKEHHANLDFVFMNLPNADLAGHTGHFEVTKAAVACLDKHLGDLVSFARARGYEVVITADHGNADDMLNPDGSPNRNHSAAPVPFIWVTDAKRQLTQPTTSSPLCISQAAATVFDIMGIDPPEDIHPSLFSDPSPK